MSAPLIHEIKGQAFRFFKEKIKTARLVLTDVTPVQLMAEEATSEKPWPRDTRTLRLISDASFEVDEYERVVEILHKRLLKFDKRYWRASYKTLILLEHLLTHGPKRVFEEFQCDIEVIEEIQLFQYVDEKGFNWGLSVARLSEKILQFLRDEDFLQKERQGARSVSRGIKGFGSFSQQSSTIDEELKERPNSKVYGRYNSYYDQCQPKEFEFTSLEGEPISADENNEQQIHKNKDLENNSNSIEDIEDTSHPFVHQEKLTTVSLLSV